MLPRESAASVWHTEARRCFHPAPKAALAVPQSSLKEQAACDSWDSPARIASSHQNQSGAHYGKHTANLVIAVIILL